MSASDFEVFVRAAGLLPRRVVPDGRWYRCVTEDHPRKKNGAYKLARDGRIGWVQNHAVHAQPLSWRAGADEALPPVDIAALWRRTRQQDRAEQQRRIEAARAFYRASAPLVGGHEYLRRHGLDLGGCRGLKVDPDGWLVVPMYRRGALMSVQKISPEGEKKFWYGAPTSETSYTIERHGAALTVLCEGLATGLALFSAVRCARAMVTFTANNLVKVAALRLVRGMVVVAADNDHRTVCQEHRRTGLLEPYAPWESRPAWCRCNPGRCAAEEAAAHLGCGYALPQNIEGTDWCDLRNERVAERLARPRYGRRHDSENALQQTVDAEITREVVSAARLVSAAG